jgi:NTP pyrophosphatase (non-canonical NTP hydrolase)
MSNNVKYPSLNLQLQTASDWVEQVNRDNGWYDEDRRFGEDIALLHSEVSEALEAYRDHGLKDMTGPTTTTMKHHPKPEGVGSELADVLVRLLDTARRCEIDLAAEFIRKVTYNGTRGYKHGGKAL